MALGVEGMTPQVPPQWLEKMLLWCLPARDRETISGDLLEEYREEQVPRVGSLQANIWYARQSISFLTVRSFGGSPMKAFLTWTSMFTVACGIWLALMENILRHAGHVERSAIAVCISIQGLATVLFLIREGRSMFRTLILTGAAGLVLLGAVAVKRTFDGAHFEGFVLLVGSSLILQGATTLMVVLSRRRGATA